MVITIRWTGLTHNGKNHARCRPTSGPYCPYSWPLTLNPSPTNGRPHKAPLLGLFHALNLALGIFKAPPYDDLVADTLKVRDPITLGWRYDPAGRALHLDP